MNREKAATSNHPYSQNFSAKLTYNQMMSAKTGPATTTDTSVPLIRSRRNVRGVTLLNPKRSSIEKIE